MVLSRRAKDPHERDDMTVNVTMLKSKIHQATVTGLDVSYEGSIVIDPALMEEVGIRRYEKVLVANLNNGERFETYAIEGKRGDRAVKLNGATARLGHVGDRLTIFAFVTMPESEAATLAPKIIQLDENNAVLRRSYVS
jgi:aspartate 1-decarboxylase